MSEKIKLLWDFRGPDSSGTAEHFRQHLRESPVLRPGEEVGMYSPSEVHSVVFLIVEAGEMPRYRDALRPHRGERVHDPSAP